MIRNLKALGLALFAVCALAAVAASAASAHEFHAEVEPVSLTGTGTNEIFQTKTSALAVTCKSVKYDATVLKKTAKEVTVNPTYKECTAEPFGAASVDMNSCDYDIYGETTKVKKTTGVEEIEEAPVTITCTKPLDHILVTAPGCTIEIPAQGKLHGVRYDNEGLLTTRDVKVTETVDKITYTTEGGKGSLTCELAGLKPEATDGTLTGNVTVKGYKDPSEHKESDHVGIWVE